MRYSLLYVQPRKSVFDPEVMMYERKVHTIDDAPNEVEANCAAAAFLKGRKMIALLPLNLPATIVQPKPEFLHDVSGSEA